MKKNLKHKHSDILLLVQSVPTKVIVISLVVCVLFLGLYVRKHNLGVWPRTGATFDEYAWTWLGMSIIQNHVPTSWSPHPQYSHAKSVIYDKVHFRLVTPYLEHPPLFGLIAGEYALLNGVENFQSLQVDKIRGLALIMGMISILYVYLLSSTLYSKRIGLLASLLYATIPTVAIGSKIVQNENFFIPCFLLALYFVVKYFKTNNAWFRNGAAIICGLLSLAKVPWLAGAFAVVLLLVYTKRYKDSLLFLSIVIPIFSLFFVYGFLLDSHLFLNLWQLQLNRYDLSFDSIFALFTAPFLVDRFYLDGWIYMGWVSFFLLMREKIEKHIFVVFPLLAYFAVFVYAVPNEPGHGWYRYPFYPFLCISLALFLEKYFSRNYFLTFFFLLFVGLALLQHTWEPTFGFSFLIFRGFILLCALPLSQLFFQTKFIAKGSKVLSYSLFILVIILNIWAGRIYNEQ